MRINAPRMGWPGQSPMLAEHEELEGRPCRSCAPGARTIKLRSLDGRSWPNTGTVPTTEIKGSDPTDSSSHDQSLNTDPHSCHRAHTRH
jgi:hypothetical protein